MDELEFVSDLVPSIHQDSRSSGEVSLPSRALYELRKSKPHSHELTDHPLLSTNFTVRSRVQLARSRFGIHAIPGSWY